MARLRARKANQLIPDQARSGRILDVGCGTYPLFLLNTRFAERFGIDQAMPVENRAEDVHVQQHNLNEESPLPFQDAFFDVVTMLAVLEHLDGHVLTSLFAEVNRVLSNGGTLVLTTPAPWTDGVLKTMARVGLLSAEEITEHKDLRSRREIVGLLVDAGFSPNGIATGLFELGANIWVRAKKGR